MPQYSVYQMIIVDGLSVLFRAFYSMRDMRNAKNQHIGAVYGFTRCLLNMIESYDPEYFTVALDTKQKTWRHEAQLDYKSNRKETPLELIPQFDLMRKACDSLNIKYYEGLAAEADDWIASCVSNYKDKANILIVSSDKDLLQLVCDTVHMFDLGKKTIVKPENVVEVWGVRPDQICDLLALTGDGADFVNGVKGIGIKTASKWLNEYDTLEKILSNADHLMPTNRRNMLKNGSEQVLHAKRMVELYSTLEVLPIEDMRVRYDLYKVKCFLEEVGLDLLGKAQKIINKHERNKGDVKKYQLFMG